MKSILISIAILTLMLTAGCEKEEGFGGRSKIKGVIVEKVYDTDFTTLQYTQVAQDEDVFIVFDNDVVNGENTSSSASGNFEFNYLNKGSYRIYYYADDTTEATRGMNIPVYHDINLGKRETLNMDTLYKYKFIDFNDGHAQIYGKVYSVNYSKNFGAIIDTTLAQNYDVFIIYNDHKNYDERERTTYNGSFAFRNLALGDYTIYALSAQKAHDVELQVILKEISITSVSQKVDLGNIYVKHED